MSLSKPVEKVLAGDAEHINNRIFHGIGKVIERKIEKKVLDHEFRLKDDVLNEIRQQKSNPKEAIAKAKRGRELLDLIGSRALEDTKKLIDGNLTEQNAMLGYGDKRIFQITVPEHLKKVLSANGIQRNVCLFHKLVEITHHCDKDIALDIGRGFRTIGESPITGLWPLRDNSSKIKKEVKDFYEAEMVLKRHKPTLDGDILDHIIEEIETDIARGRYREIARDMLKVQPMLAFGVRQKEKIRIIIDERMKNSYSTLSEKLILKGTNYLIEAIRAFQCEVGLEGKEEMMPGTQRAKAAYKSILEELNDWRENSSASNFSREDLKGSLPSDLRDAMKRKNLRRAVRAKLGRGPAAGLRDFKKAYYQVGCADPQENTIQAYDRAMKTWRYFEANSLTMGNTHNVTNWCRIAEAAEWFSRKIGGLVQFIYIDDSTTLAVNEDVLVEQMSFLDELNRHLGLEISEKAEARQDSITSDSMSILGLEYAFKPEKTTITVPDKKKTKIIDLCEQIILDLDEKQTKHHDFQVLIGNLVYALYSSGERSGNAVLQGIYPWFSENYYDKWIVVRDKRRALVRTLRFIISITKAMKPVEMTPQNAVRPIVHLFTDASTDGGLNGGGGLGAALLDEDGSWRVVTLEVPTERIDILELKAVLLALETFQIKNKEVVCHVDNAGDVYALIRGVHKSQRGSAIIHKTYEQLVSNNCSVFWDYIKSEANIADFFTRREKEQAGLLWTGAALERPVHKELDLIDKETRPVFLAEPLPEGDIPGWWVEDLKRIADQGEDFCSKIEKKLARTKDTDQQDWDDNLDFLTWNSNARKLADIIQHDVPEDIGEPNPMRQRVL